MRIDLLMGSLPVMGAGYLGVFVVIGAIIVVITLLARITSR